MLKQLTLSVVLAALCTGCTQRTYVGGGPDFEMSGSAEGIRAYNDGVSGAIKTGKESADAHSEYFAARGNQEKEVTKRVTAPNFLSGLFASSGPATNSGHE